MKKILTIASAVLVSLASCDLDINDNPNYPANADVTSALIFPSAENAIADCVGDQMFNYAGFFAQYFDQMPTANQYNDLAELNLNESSNLFDRCYNVLYAGALADLQEISGRDDVNTADKFACAVLRAYTFQILVDNLDQVPYSEALKGTEITMPKWDEGKDVYNGVLAELDKAESALTDATMTVTDPMLNKNVDAWKRFANSLRLRMLLRLIDGGVDAAANTSKAQSLVAANKFIEDDVTWSVYSNAEGQYNPWYAGYYSLGTKNHCAAYPIVSYMDKTGDPRISYALSPRTKDNTYVGQIPGAKTVEAAWLGLTAATYQDNMVSNVKYDVMRSTGIAMMTVAEVELLKAEVELRFNNNPSAAKADYEAGIAADFAFRGAGSPDAFLGNATVAWGSDKDANLKNIYMQKWVALFMRDHMEAWTEARRTDVPALSTADGETIIKDFAHSGYEAGQFIEPSVNYILARGIAKRIPYPANARSLNKNTPATKLLSDKVFWDVK